MQACTATGPTRQQFEAVVIVMSSGSGNIVHTVWRWYATTLLDPPPASWVARVASTFYVLAILIFIPMAFITGLDIASWLIMRTMGTISADLPPETVVRNVAADAHDKDQAVHAPVAKRRQSGALGLQLSITPADGQPEVHESVYGSGGTSPLSEHLHSNSALAGDGIFSPIVSRAASPELVRRKGSVAGSSSASSSFVDLGSLTPAGTAAGSGTGSLRKRTAVH